MDKPHLYCVNPLESHVENSQNKNHFTCGRSHQVPTYIFLALWQLHKQWLKGPLYAPVLTRIQLEVLHGRSSTVTKARRWSDQNLDSICEVTSGSSQCPALDGIQSCLRTSKSCLPILIPHWVLEKLSPLCIQSRVRLALPGSQSTSVRTLPCQTHKLQCWIRWTESPNQLPNFAWKTNHTPVKQLLSYYNLPPSTIIYQLRASMLRHLKYVLPDSTIAGENRSPKLDIGSSKCWA